MRYFNFIIIYSLFTFLNCNFLFSQEINSEQLLLLSQINSFDTSFEDEDLTEDPLERNPFYEKIQRSLKTNISIEDRYQKRSKEKIYLQGYEFFLNKFLPNTNYPGNIHENYILGPGDTVILTLQGGTQGIKKSTVSREGVLIFDFYPPIAVSGKSFSDARKEIQNAVKASLIETDVFISLKRIRNVSINIMGEVNNPGMISLNGLSTVKDALIFAGGIKKGGSLRNILVYKNNNVETLDLYPFIFFTGEFKAKNIPLQDGMVIVVITIKKTAAIVGEVFREGIYEIIGDNETVDDLVKYSGGYSGPTNKTLALKRLDQKGADIVTSNFGEDFKIKDYDLVFANNVDTKIFGQVKLSGAVKSPSIFAIDKFSNIQNLISNVDVLKDNAYTFSSVILNKNPNTLYDEFKIVNLQSILNKTSNFDLKNNDEIIILDKGDLEFLRDPSVLKTLRGNKLTSNRCKALEELSLKTKTKANDFSTNTIYNELDKLQANELSQLKVNEELILGDETSVGISSGKNIVENNKATNMVNNKTEKPCPDIFEQYPNLLSFLIENIIILKGNFQFPGIHLIDSKTNLRENIKFCWC